MSSGLITGNGRIVIGRPGGDPDYATAKTVYMQSEDWGTSTVALENSPDGTNWFPMGVAFAADGYVSDVEFEGQLALNTAGYTSPDGIRYWVGSAPYGGPPLGAGFNGTTAFANRSSGLDGATDGKKGIVSCFVDLLGGDGTLVYVITNSFARFALRRETNNLWELSARNPANDEILNVKSNQAYTVSSGQLHILASWDLNNPGFERMIIDGVDVTSVSTATDDSIDYTLSSWYVGSYTTEANKLNGCVKELYVNTVDSMDLSNPLNWTRFRTPDGQPKLLGDNGELPTGKQPIIYMSRRGDVSGFVANRGYGGGFTDNNLTKC